MTLVNQDDSARTQQLKDVANAYFESLRKINFETIPYHEKALLRAPLTPGGVEVPLSGKQALYNEWWQPLEPALKGVVITIRGYYFHENLDGIMCEAEVTLPGPGVTLRVADRFTVDVDGKITEQENHFDPRAVTGG